MKKQNIPLLLLGVVLLIAIGISWYSAFSSEKQKIVSKKDPVPPPATVVSKKVNSDDANKIILSIDEWAPFTSANIEQNGICSEIVYEAAKAAGLECEFKFVPWSRALEMTKFGESWGTFPWFYTTERSKDYLYSSLLFNGKQMLFVHKSNPRIQKSTPSYKSLLDLKAYKFGGVSGYYYEKVFEENHFKYDLSYDLESAFQQLAEDRIDMIIEDEAVGGYTINKLFKDRASEFTALSKPLEEQKMFLIATKSSPDAANKMERFNQGLKIIKDNGVYNDILRKNNLIR